jgi:DNA replication protein DnaC
MDSLDEILKHSPSNIPDLKITESPELSDAERRESLRRVLNITSWENTFDYFHPVKGSVESLKAFKAISSGKTSWHMLLSIGRAGCGKTHLCEALSIALNNQGIKCRVWEWSEIIRNLKKAMRLNNGSYDELFEGFCRAPRLIIDDLGMGGADSAWAWGELEDIINYRYRQGLFTVVTTNLDLTSLPDRVVSRFRDAIKSRIVLNEASDYRPEKGK